MKEQISKNSDPTRHNVSTQLAAAWSHAPTGCYCHLTSVFFHALTQQIPQKVFIRRRDIAPRKTKRPETLSDSQIRSQFIKPQKVTGKRVPLPGGECVLISGYKNDQTGVIPVPNEFRAFPADARITDLERCLIDAVVAPHYNGGIMSLPALFAEAADQLNLQTLIGHYGELEFLYPFHQTIGFFLHHSGQTEAAERWRETFQPTNRFFVDKNAKTNWGYDTVWHVYYPRGLIHAD
jgi:hypothetical protein